MILFLFQGQDHLVGKIISLCLLFVYGYITGSTVTNFYFIQFPPISQSHATPPFHIDKTFPTLSFPRVSRPDSTLDLLHSLTRYTPFL